MSKEQVTMCNACKLVQFNRETEEAFCSLEGRLVSFGTGTLKCIIDIPRWCPMNYHPSKLSLHQLPEIYKVTHDKPYVYCPNCGQPWEDDLAVLCCPCDEV